MSTNIIIGNLISLVAAVFTAKSSWAKDIWHIYFYQVVQCALLAVASIFFNSYAGIVTLLVCAFRNYLAAKEMLDRKWTLICLVLVVVFGVWFNNRGIIGMFILAATVLYTVGMHIAKGELAIKLNIELNLLLWAIYEIMILDISSFAADAAAFVVTTASIFKLLAARRSTERE